MDITKLPDEIINNIFRFSDWKSIVMFVSTNTTFYKLRENKIFAETIKKLYFKDSDICNLLFDKTSLYREICNNKFDIIISQIKYCELKKKNLESVNYEIDFINNHINELIKHIQEHESDNILSIINLDIENLDKYLVKNVNDNILFVNNNKLLYNFFINIICLRNSLYYENIYEEYNPNQVILCIDDILDLILDNYFIDDIYLIKFLDSFRDFYLGDILHEEFLYYSRPYDNFKKYLDCLKKCITHSNNSKLTYKIYIGEVRMALKLCDLSIYRKKLLKEILNLFLLTIINFNKYVVSHDIIYLFEIIIKHEYYNNFLKLYEMNFFIDVLYNINIPEKSICYSIVFDYLYESIKILIDDRENKIIVTDIILDIITKFQGNKYFIYKNSRRFLKILEDKINQKICDIELLNLTQSILICDFMSKKNQESLVKFTYEKIRSKDKYILVSKIDKEIKDIELVNYFNFEPLAYREKQERNISLKEVVGYSKYSIYLNNYNNLNLTSTF